MVRSSRKELPVLELIIPVPLPLVLFILVLALVGRGFVDRPQKLETKKLWLVLGFSEIAFAFVCFTVVPLIGYYYSVSILELLAPIIFCVASMGAALYGLFLLIKETP